MDLLERDEPLAILDSCLADAGAGSGRMVLVRGEAGIGKTALIREFCAAHAADAHVWWGACDALSTPRPLGPLYDIARAAGGDLSASMASDASRHDRFSGFLEMLCLPLRPVIAVIEDVHWADDATRDLLIFVARRIGDTNAVVVVTYRDDEVGAEHPLRTVLGQLATHEPVRRISLAPFTADAVAFLAGRAVDIGNVYRVTGGNPFFVTEVLAAASAAVPSSIAAVPSSIADAVLARASRLSGLARLALEAAAIVPDVVEVALVSAIAGDAGGVDECIDRGLLIADGRAVRFRHELSRLAVEQAIAPSRLPDMHAAALEYLAGQTGVDSARLAYHADQAGDQTAVLIHAPAAAERASRLSAHRQAAAHYVSALGHADVLTGSEHAELLERYAHECGLLGWHDEELEAQETALDIWQTIADMGRVGRLLARHSASLWSVARPDEAYDAAHRAVAALEAQPEGPSLAAAYAQLAGLHMLGRRVRDAVDVGTRAAELAERFGDSAGMARALNVVGSALWFIDPGQAEGSLMRSLDIARRTGDDSRAAVAMTNLGSGAGEVRRYATADRWLREGLEWAVQRDLDVSRDYARAWLARTHFEQGRWSAAGLVAGSVANSAGVISRIVALTVLGRLRVRRGDPDPEGPLSEAWELAMRTGDLQRLWPAAAGRAEVAWLAGNSERVPGLVEDTFDMAVELDQQWPIGELGFWLWQVGALDRVPAGAAPPYALQIDGDWWAAAQAWDEIGCPFEQACALADSDEPGDLRAALEILSRLGAGPLADRVVARLRELGVRDLPRRPTRATLENPAGLTNREMEVLALLGDGRTNADIAAVLHISPKTVGHHVSAILAKLDVHDRLAAVRAAREQGVVPT